MTPEHMLDFFDRNAVTCGNCSAQIVARGGTRGEHHGVTAEDGERERLCGFCAGEELERLRASEAALKQANKEAEAEFLKEREQVAALTKERDLLQFAVAAHERNLQEHSDALNQRGAELDRLRAEQRIPPGMTAEKLVLIASWFDVLDEFHGFPGREVQYDLREWAAWLREQPKQQERIAPQGETK